MSKSVKIGIVIVSYGHEREIPVILRALKGQIRSGDQIVVVDNHPEHKAAQVAREVDSVVAIEAVNKGFSYGCNLGAERIQDKVDILFFLNPDTVPSENVLDALRDADTAKYAAFMPLLVLPDGNVNSAGNVVHLSGLSWCDGYLASRKEYTQDKFVTVLSGACAAVSVTWWRKVGGLCEDYFLYYEDTDLSTRLLLAGGKLGLLPQSTVTHDYDYSKGAHKWLYLERNRYLYIFRTWPAAVILVLAPLLVCVEVGLWMVAIMQRRFISKIKATFLFIQILPSAVTDRRKIQRSRTLSSYDFLLTLTADLDTPVLGVLGRSVLINNLFRGYKKVVAFLLLPSK